MFLHSLIICQLFCKICSCLSDEWVLVPECDEQTTTPNEDRTEVKVFSETHTSTIDVLYSTKINILKKTSTLSTNMMVTWAIIITLLLGGGLLFSSGINIMVYLPSLYPKHIQDKDKSGYGLPIYFLLFIIFILILLLAICSFNNWKKVSRSNIYKLTINRYSPYDSIKSFVNRSFKSIIN